MSIIISSIAIAVNPLAHTLWHTYICVCKCALLFCFIYFLWPTAVIFCLIYLFQFFAQLNLYLQQSFIRYTRTICLTRYMAQFRLHSYSLHTSPKRKIKRVASLGDRVKYQFLLLTFEKFYLIFIHFTRHHSFYSFRLVMSFSQCKRLAHQFFMCHAKHKIFSHWFNSVFYTAKRQ